MTSQELKDFRKRFNWSQSELAKRLGCSPRSIANWEGGKTAIPESIALAVSAVALNIPPYGKMDI
jgi:transcriptional regulator with XRE-family HTH domain